MSFTLQNILKQASATITSDSLQPSNLSFIADDVTQAIAKAVPVQPTSTPGGAPFSTIYAFGDSLTDAGNVSVATLGAVPVSPPYADHVFSNGPVWVQDLAESLGFSGMAPSLTGGTDFAYGGAETGQTPTHNANPTDLPSQIGQFTAQVSSPQSHALYAMWIGANDVLDIANNTSLTAPQQQADVKAAVANEAVAIQTLAARGAHDFLVLDVPDLGKTPYEQARPAVTQTASTLSAMYDTDLATAIHGLEASGALKIDLVDTFTLLNEAIANPNAAGFTDVTHPAWTGNLVDGHSGTLSPTSSTHLFFDGLHPTAMTHALLANQVGQTLTLA